MCACNGFEQGTLRETPYSSPGDTVSQPLDAMSSGVASVAELACYCFAVGKKRKSCLLVVRWRQNTLFDLTTGAWRSPEDHRVRSTIQKRDA
jgi:hypothetical protein